MPLFLGCWCSERFAPPEYGRVHRSAPEGEKNEREKMNRFSLMFDSDFDYGRAKRALKVVLMGDYTRFVRATMAAALEDCSRAFSTHFALGSVSFALSLFFPCRRSREPRVRSFSTAVLWIFTACSGAPGIELQSVFSNYHLGHAS